MSIQLSKKQKITLIKEREQKLSVVLSKVSTQKIVAKVGLVIDISGSMRSLYKSGVVQDIVERLFPIAKKFDDDGELDFWVFSHTYNRLVSVNESNFDTFINDNILNTKLSSAWGRTEYAPVMEDVISAYKDSVQPVYVIFITDGQNSDKKQATEVITRSSVQPIFWQYIGIGNEEFKFLQKLDDLKGRAIDNANFFSLNNITSISDEELYSRLLNEFPSWLDEAQQMRIVR